MNKSKLKPVTYDGENVAKFAAASKRVKGGKYANAPLFEALKKAADSARKRKEFLHKFSEADQEFLACFARMLTGMMQAEKILIGDKLNNELLALQAKINRLFNRAAKSTTAEDWISAERKWIAALRAEKTKIDWRLVETVFPEKWKLVRAIDKNCKRFNLSLGDVFRLSRLNEKADDEAKKLGEIIAAERLNDRASFCDEFARIWQREQCVDRRDNFLRQAAWELFCKDKRKEADGGGQLVGYTKNDVVRLAEKFASDKGCSLEFQTRELTKAWKRLGLEWLPSKAAGRPRGIGKIHLRRNKKLPSEKVKRGR